ncbi:MAG: hypothetical protein M1834_006267 [Cirrosporium novae-zelandiae]|nr:MAG: hypothetical protein M1834_006267 [Cirrosporium novae-zelandiae]
MANISPGIRISIDRGGTFCDGIAQIPGREDIILKLLSEDPRNYPDAPYETIRRILEAVEGRSIPVGEKLDGSRIGMKDVAELGDQSRPRLFDLNIRKPEVLFSRVVELDERVTIEDYDLNPYPKTEFDENDKKLVKTASGEVIRIIQELDIETTKDQLRRLRQDGFSSIAICLMHSHIFPDHEMIVASLARDMGFEFISSSSQLSPNIKILRRTTAACVDAYLSPIVRRYVDGFLSRFKDPPQRVDFMCSDGGLKNSQTFSGNPALLSGPAGGVVGIARSCYDPEEGTAIIGFDMGGTSTDVSRYSGNFEHILDTTIAGRAISTPMLNISTVAAGGGSILFARNGLLVVGPESAGAHPGPACYRKGGPLTITDANLFLGRLVLSSFPSIFGDDADQPLDVSVVTKKFQEITDSVNEQSNTLYTLEQVALGFIKVANESMSRPIRNITEARGFATYDHNLVSFGGAGGQHACAIASNLGIQRILIHKYSSVLSAHGISLAEIESEASEPSALVFSMDALPRISERAQILQARVENDLCSQGVKEGFIEFKTYLSLRYKGMNTNIPIVQPPDEDYGAVFTREHLREFAFSSNKDILVDSIKVRGIGKQGYERGVNSLFKELELAKRDRVVPLQSSAQQVFLNDGWQEVPIFELDGLQSRSHIKGPALITDKTQTILVESGFNSFITSSHVIIEKVQEEKPRDVISEERTNPVQLSVFANRFMSIAEQMGNTLQRTSISTSIKERLDFSCAIFSDDGALVANAPHIPVHLGSMQYAIQYQHRMWGDKLRPGDVLLTNHPEAGGTHLPDLTVITPAFYEDKLIFYVASRGHHTDIGGIGITSMVPDSKELWEEGVSIKSLKIVSGGKFLENEIRDAFESVAQNPGCSASRRINDNISDLKAQVSANQRGINLIGRLCEEYSLPVVHKYMRGIQANAEVAIKNFLRETYKKTKGKSLKAVDFYDDGTPVALEITINGKDGTAVFDFKGTGPQTYGNMNSPISITHSAVIYALRCLIDLEIPLNQGCLNPVHIRIPKGTILNPSPTVAICGSTIASQRITDVIFKAFDSCAAAQGCANSFGWGMGGKDPRTGIVRPGWNYGEALGGGSGAGPTWHGAHGVNVHATNTKNTDAEIIEKRTPVLVRKYEIRRGSGGKGKFNGGDGIVREIEARVPLKFSILSERRVYNPYGMHGGYPGGLGKNYMFKKNAKGALEKISLGGKAVVNLQVGEIMQINTPGGGGWGKPGNAQETVSALEVRLQPITHRPNSFLAQPTTRRYREPGMDQNSIISSVEVIIGYRFMDRSILWEALHAPGSLFPVIGNHCLAEGNKRLAIVGDAILRSALIETWYINGGAKVEADRKLQQIASNINLNLVGRNKGLDSFVQGNPSQGRVVAPRTMADTIEAVLGAVYLDGGMIHAKEAMTVLGLIIFANDNLLEETFADYRQGGYHPMRIGNSFSNGKYEVVRKLGYGGYSTVWLVRDLETNRHLALKILRAYTYGGQNDTFELSILEHIKTTNPSNPGAKHILGLLDHFQHQGPHGEHLCLVFKAMGPDLRTYLWLFPERIIPMPLLKKISKQLLLALAYLHQSCRVIHMGKFGPPPPLLNEWKIAEPHRLTQFPMHSLDIKPQNILIETTEINEIFESLPSSAFRQPSPPLDPPNDFYMQSEVVASATEDLSAPPEDFSVRLNDFGTSSWFDKHFLENIQPKMLRAPEVILGAKWDSSADIWNLGAIMANSLSRTHTPMPRPTNETPGTLSSKSPSLSSSFEGFIDKSSLVIEEEEEEEEEKDFVEFITSMLRLAPEERPSATDLLGAKWLQTMSV